MPAWLRLGWQVIRGRPQRPAAEIWRAKQLRTEVALPMPRLANDAAFRPNSTLYPDMLAD